MDTVTGADMANKMYEHGGRGVIHRYNTIEEQVEIASRSKDPIVAVGVSGDYLERIDAHVEIGIQNFCIDVAHGHTKMMREALESIRAKHGTYLNIMAGNVATLEGFNDLADWGADSIRVGIGGGSICSSRVQTGHGMPTFASILECARTDRDAALVADGGIRTAGDIVKALGAGADAVMLGSMLAGTDEAPGEIIYNDGEGRKVYRGMASKEAQIDWRGRTASLEGVSTTIPCKGPVSRILSEIESRVKSGLSYSGAFTLIDFQLKCEFRRVSTNSIQESVTHILHT
jgi:IMP dehydrogenase